MPNGPKRRALPGRTLQSAAAYHRSLIDFDWQDAGQSDGYEYPVSFNRRRYARVYIEMIMEPEEELADWKRKMLEKFQCQRPVLGTVERVMCRLVRIKGFDLYRFGEASEINTVTHTPLPSSSQGPHHLLAASLCTYSLLSLYSWT